jgi:hypothetical protein
MIRAAQARDTRKRKRFREMAPVLNEQCLRRFVAMEARAPTKNPRQKNN